MAERQPVAIARDPFARAELIRETDSQPVGTCAFCGNRSARGFLFRYYWQPDGDMYGRARLLAERRWFCCVGCWRDYYGE